MSSLRPRSADAATDTLNLANRAIGNTIRRDTAVRAHIVRSLMAAGRLHSVTTEREMLVDSTIRRFAMIVETLVDLAVTEAMSEDDLRVAEIREFFLQPHEAYSLAELACLWRISLDEARAVYHDEILQWEDSHGREGAQTSRVMQIRWPKAMGMTVAFGFLRSVEIERALGKEFMNARSERWRTVPILLHLPRFVAAAFELDAAIPPTLALAQRIEQILLEFFGTEKLIDASQREDLQR